MTALRKHHLNAFPLIVALCAFAVMFGHGESYASKGDLVSLRPSVESVQAPLFLTLGKADILNLPEGVSDVLVANPTIVDVQAVQSNRLYAVGLNIGDTNVIILDAKGNVLKRIDIHVSYDLQAIQSTVEKLFPDEQVKVGCVHDQIILTGIASSPEVAGKISNLVAHYVSDLQDTEGTIDYLISNLLEVRGEQQVMLQVKIIEAERSVIKELGVDFSVNDPDELSVSTLWGATPYSNIGGRGNAVGLGGASGLTLSQDAVGVASGFLDTNISGIGTLGLFLEALEEENLVNMLAEPNLTAVSGQQAGFLAGGEFPVPSGRDQYGNITIEYREFGVSLNFKPVVMSEKRISLQLNTEVSSLDVANGVTLADLVVPGLDIRRTNTTIEIPSGGSLMIAGLLQSETIEGLKGLPGVKDMPILGDLMSSDSFQREETELVVIVTAYLVEPYAEKQDSEKLPKKKQGRLATIFSDNIRRTYELEDNSMFAKAGVFGYIVD
ncbi:MAG: type II and III secretion system protein family protein [Alphaproteobacteria bacterium]|nr:type II and III secretion system protein family protein [Alphaproteobacteria bacterium]